MSAAASRLEPPVAPGAEPFWDATREGTLVLPWCTDCEAPFFYPRPTCPRCLASTIDWRPASGHATVYAVTVEHRLPSPMSGTPEPYAIALVELDEGPRMLTNVVGAAPSDVAVGDRVVVTWEPLSDGRQLPLFQPVAT